MPRRSRTSSREQDRQIRHRRRRLPRPDRAAPAGGAAHRADRRRRGAGAPARHDRWFTISAPPTSPPAGRARRWCRCSISALARDLDRPHPIAVLNIGGVANVTYRRRRRSDRLRHRAGQCADRRFHARAHRRAARPRRRSGGARAASTRPLSRACWTIRSSASRAPKSLDRNAFAFANIGLPDFSVADGAATLVGAHRGVGRAGRAASAGAAAQPGSLPAAARAIRPSCACWRNACAPATVETADAVGWSLAGDRSAGLRLSGGAYPQRSADYFSDHDRGEQAVAGRYCCTSAQLTRCPIYRSFPALL